MAGRRTVAIERNIAGKGDAHTCQHDEREYLHRALDDVVLSEVVDAQAVCQQFIDGKGAKHDEYLYGECPYDVASHSRVELILDDLQHASTFV